MVTDRNGKLDITKHAGYWLRDGNGELTKAFRHICWDGCMFPNEVMMKQQTWNDILARHDQGARQAWVGGADMAKKKLNVGMVGYGFMGRTHSNAFSQVAAFLRPATIKPVLKTICARSADKAKAFADQWGYESSVTDWRQLVDDKSIDLIDIASPNDTHLEIAIAAAAGRQDGDVRKAAGPQRRRDPRRWWKPSRRRACPTWSGTTTAAFRPSRWPSN